MFGWYKNGTAKTETSRSRVVQEGLVEGLAEIEYKTLYISMTDSSLMPCHALSSPQSPQVSPLLLDSPPATNGSFPPKDLSLSGCPLGGGIAGKKGG